jgi:membrane protein DedA with SNARE-associated domain
LLGRAMGFQRLRPFVDRWGRWLTLDWAEVEALVRFFSRHGQWVVFVVRFAPVMRTMISLPAGMAKMSWLRFTLFTLAGTSVWNAILLGAGFWLGRNFGVIDQVTGPLALAVAILVGAWYIWRVITYPRRG